MRISKALSLVIPIERDDGMVLFAHSTPIEEATFLSYHRPLMMTYAQMDADGLIRSGGIRNADLILKEVSERIGIWKDNDGTIGVERGLLEEIRRLTNVFAPTGTKWEAVPLVECVNRDVLSAPEAREVAAAACFFCASSHGFPRQNLKEFLQICSGRIGASVTYLSSQAFANSLPTLTEGENSGETAAAWWDKFSSPAQPASASQKS